MKNWRVKSHSFGFRFLGVIYKFLIIRDRRKDSEKKGK
jgi:hypothetical protein